MALSRRAVRVVFGVTLAWITVLQYVLLVLAREEPYPALILPGFPAACPGCLLESGVVANKNPELTVRFGDGTRRQVSIEEILPQGTSVSLMAFTAAFKDDSVKDRPEAIEWLHSRAQKLFANQEISGLDIAWRSAIYGAADPAAVSYQPLHTIGVDFGDPE